MELKIGNEYKRSELHDTFGGNRQGGIAPCANTDIIFIFSGASGEQYGYADGWDGDFYHYTGEGRFGDMDFSRSNAAIRDHESIGKRILLMKSTRPTFVEYAAELRCVDYEYFETHDFDDKNRRAIRFILESANSNASNTAATGINGPRPQGRKPTKIERRGLVTSRVGQGWYRRAILDKFNRCCAVTGFDSEELLIASHIVPWRDSNDEEKLDVNNGILLSPNYDALFDKHLISFMDSGDILLSDKLTDVQRMSLKLNPSASIIVTEEMIPYLTLHRQELR